MVTDMKRTQNDVPAAVQRHIVQASAGVVKCKYRNKFQYNDDKCLMVTGLQHRLLMKMNDASTLPPSVQK